MFPDADSLFANGAIVSSHLSEVIDINSALKQEASHREEALAAIEQEGDQFVENQVLSAPLRYAKIPLEHRNNILKVFQFVVDKHNANGLKQKS